MNILILNGNPVDGDKDFDQKLYHLENALSDNNNQVEIINIRDLNVIHCKGCWGCWVKTPGRCSVKDDTVEVRKAYMNSDMVIFASPIIMGFITSGLKKVMDKLIPLLHPYIEIVDGEAHHSKRHKKYPLIGFLHENLSHDPEDVEISTEIFNRFAINFRSVLIFSFSLTNEMSNLINEIDSY